MTGLADALQAEHAVVFGYGVVGAHLRGSLRGAGRDAEEAHRKRRDAVLLRLTDQDVTPPAAEPAYPLPFKVTDSDTAVKLATHLEEAAAQVWRAALGPAKGADRKLCLDALIDSAVRAARWRQTAKQPPEALPGAPG
ncbi:MAG: ferritin-like domain-containing protein [Micromonosporaceae bacterium]